MTDSATTQQRNRMLYERARALMPGGVSSPVRSFGKVGGTPFFVERGAGAMLIDEDGREYIDFVMSWGACVVYQLAVATTAGSFSTRASASSAAV